jgi:RNA polymerase sigma-70 factor (ECF subfamily)
MTDGELVRQALSNHRPAYETLAQRRSARVLAVCHSRVGRAAAAEDLAQETLLRGLKALSTLTDPEKFGPWLCGIETRTCLDWLKKSERTEVSIGERDFGDNGDVSTYLEKVDEIGRLMREVEKLPQAHREALMLYYYEDCTYADLAKRLGVSAATINARLTQARQMLREKLDAPAVMAARLKREDVKHDL